MTDLNRRQKLVVLAMDLMMLAELAVAIYVGRHCQCDLTLVFLSIFLPSLVLTVAAARFLLRRWQTPAAPMAAQGGPA